MSHEGSAGGEGRAAVRLPSAHRRSHACLIVVFLAIITCVPLAQMLLEWSRGERPQCLEVFRQQPTAAHLRAYERDLEEASWAARALRPWVQVVHFLWLKDGGEKTLVGRDGWLFYKPGVQAATERTQVRKGSSTAVEAAAAIMAFRDQLATRGTRLLVLPVPNKESVYPEKLTRRTGLLTNFVCPETKELLSRLAAAQVEVVNLFDAFALAKAAPVGNAPPALYLTQDSHWSPAGLDLAARTVAERILQNNWARLGPVDYGAKPAPVRRTGDLVEMFQSPQITHAVSPEEVPTIQVLQPKDGSLYKDDPAAQILVLGDSFLRIYQTDEPEAAGFIAHLARELKQPLTSLVSDGGASTLVRQELFRRPALLARKKLVIWEFVERDIRLGAEGWQKVPLPPP